MLLSFKSYVSYLLLMMLFLGLVLGEKKSSYCGAGLLNVELPNNLFIHWFNGQSLFENKDGFVFYPNQKIIYEESTIKVKFILKYKFNNQSILISFKSVGGSNYLALINMYPLRIRILNSINKVSLFGESYSKWVKVKAENCFFGRWFVFRIILLVLILLLIGSIVSNSKNKSRGVRPSKVNSSSG